MWNYEKARKLAQTWINLNCDIEAEIIEDETITKPYGWVFFYQGKSYLRTQNLSDMILGNSPILIDKINGEIKVFGTALNIEEYLSEYEEAISESRLKMSVEFPNSKL